MTKPTLLLVDDEERILRSLRVMFMSHYNVRMTTDAYEAIRILRDEKVHVIISDQRMPIMQGSELLRISCEVSPVTMRILLTGYSDLNASISSVNEGEVFRYLLKPWVGEEVKKIVAEATAIAEASYSVQEYLKDDEVQSHGRPKILILDSDKSTATMVFEILGDRCDIVLAQNEEEALEEISKHKNVSVVVSDVVLDGSDVSYILKTIKKISPQTQSIIVSSYKDTANLIDLINEAQITRYMPKPISRNLMSGYLESMLLRINKIANQPILANRQTVAPIRNPTEIAKSGRFMDLLDRMRSRLGV
jgi:serine/threonine-protein kinase